MNQTFSQKKRFWIEIFFQFKISGFQFNMSGFGLRIYCPGRYWKDYFSNNHISEKLISKDEVLSSIFEEKDFDEKFMSEKKIVLIQFVAKKATEFSLFVLVLKSLVLKQIFSLKISVWSEVLSKKRIRLWCKVFPRNWDFELKIFHLVRFWIENLSSRKISKTKLFEESFFGENLVSENSGFEFNFYWEIRFRW